jgi:hypothetical protein
MNQPQIKEASIFVVASHLAASKIFSQDNKKAEQKVRLNPFHVFYF